MGGVCLPARWDRVRCAGPVASQLAGLKDEDLPALFYGHEYFMIAAENGLSHDPAVAEISMAARFNPDIYHRHLRGL